MYQVLGWLNVALVVMQLIPLLLKVKQVRQQVLVKQTIQHIRKLHRISGILLTMSILLHGYLALGRIILHTGVIAGGWALLTVSVGSLHYYMKNKKKWIFILHRSLAGVLVGLILVHLFVPGLL